MEYLDDLRVGLNNAQQNKDGNTFHLTLDILLDLIGFSKTHESFGVIVRSWDYAPKGGTVNRETMCYGLDLEKIKQLDFFLNLSSSPIKELCRVCNYMRGDVLFEIQTNYKSLPDLENGTFSRSQISSNSKLTSRRNVFNLSYLKNIRPDLEESQLLKVASSSYGLVKKEKLFLFDPESFLELLSSEPITMYFQVKYNLK